MADPTSIERLRAFLFPEGEDRLRGVREIHTRQRGEIRMSPDAGWVSFTAEEVIDATRSRFCWESRVGGGRFGFVTVTDAYEGGRGRLVVKAGGIVPLKTVTNSDIDNGELQRYLAGVVCCPAMLLNNASLEWTASGPRTVWVRERSKPQTKVEIDVAEDGRPIRCRADRPRMVGKQMLLTPWRGSLVEFQQWDGMRVVSRLEVSWLLPEATFTYYRGEVLSLRCVTRGQ